LSKLYDDRRLAQRLTRWSKGPLNAAARLAHKLGLEERVPSWAEWLQRLYEESGTASYRPVEGVLALLEAIDADYDLGLLTHWRQRETGQILEQLGVQDRFSAIVTRRRVGRHKPAARAIRRAAKKLGHAPEQAIVVSSRALDLRAGAEVGALTVGVVSGLERRSELERFEPDLVLDRPGELAEHLSAD
jgi:phosphoglycolate phosphatase